MRTWAGVLVIAMLVVGVLFAKSMKSSSSAARASAPAAATLSQSQPRVLLFANPREAGESCGCGEIFREVRAAGAKGVKTREVDPKQEEDLVRQYRVTVEPTVIFVDTSGRELSRKEGESDDTLAAIRTELHRLAGEQQ